jgi:hypothetical protein
MVRPAVTCFVNEALGNFLGGPTAEFILIVPSVVVFRPDWTVCLAKFDFCLSSSFVYLTKLDPLMNRVPQNLNRTVTETGVFVFFSRLNFDSQISVNYL